MSIAFRHVKQKEQEIVFTLLKEAAQLLNLKEIDQWAFWLNPSKEKIEWIKEGFAKNEFYFITLSENIIGMFRLLDEDLFYWGNEKQKAKYIHSLVIKEKYSGKQIGKQVIDRISLNLTNQNIFILRLDCNASNPKLCQYYENQGFIKIRQKRMSHSLNNLYQKNLFPNKNTSMI